MDSTKSLARRAGLLYLLGCLPAPFALIYLPSVLLVQGDAVATADRIRVSEGLLRAGIAAELLSPTLIIFAVLALYHLFKEVHEKTALAMAVLMLISVPISYLNAVNHIAPLVLVKNPAIVSALDRNQIAALVTLFLRLHDYGLVVAQIFWGLWLIPYGILVMRSRFVPRALAYPLFAAGAAYVINSLGMLFLPPSLRWIAQYAMILGAGELPILVWLLIWGARSTSSSAFAPRRNIAPVAAGHAGRE